MVFDEARAILHHLSLHEQKEWYVWKEGWKKWKSVVQVEGITEDINRTMYERMPNLPVKSDLEILVSTEENHLDVDDVSIGNLELENSGALTSPTLRAIPNEEERNEKLDLTGTMATVFEPNIVNGIHQTNDVSEDLERETKITTYESVSVGPGKIKERNYKRYDREYLIEIDCNGKKFTTKSVDVGVGGIHLQDILPEWVVGYFKVRIRKPHEKRSVELTSYLVENQSPTHRRRIALLPLQDRADETKLEDWLKAA